MPLREPNTDGWLTLVRQSIEAFDLDLRGLTVLTEAASGPFVTTPLIAATAGAERVYALTADSRYAAADEVARSTTALAQEWGVGDRVEVMTCRDDSRLNGAEVITNLGFVRPLNRTMLARFGGNAALALMFEPWELRPGDVDIEACRELGIPVLGTNEDDPRLQTFKYLGPMAAKLLAELGIEASTSRLILVASGKFAAETRKGLQDIGASVTVFEPPLSIDDPVFADALEGADALVAADHGGNKPILGKGDALQASRMLEKNPDIVLAHISGDVDVEEIAASGLRHAPARLAPAGHMSVTAGYVGAKPVIDLHTAGLTVGTALSRARQEGLNGTAAEARVLAELPLAMGLNATPNEMPS